MGIFRKNKRQFGFRSHRNLFVAIFLLVFAATTIVSIILNAQAEQEPVHSVEITSSHVNYAEEEPGAWKVIKSAKWTDTGKARITFEINSIAKYSEGDNYDVILVADNSLSMDGNKLLRTKTDFSDLANSLLSDPNNRVALVSFGTTATILSGFTNNKANILNKIDSMEAIGNVNYNDALIKVSEVLQGYTQQSNRKLVMILLTNNYPNEETPNEVAQYQTLKANYPYLSINGIQYEKGSSIMPQLSNITDHQYVATMNTLNETLFEITRSPYYYDDLVITDYIQDAYWTVSGTQAIRASLGEVSLENDNGTPKITWDMSEIYRSGQTATLTIDVNLKDEIFAINTLFSTNKHETIVSSLTGTTDENVNSTLTPTLGGWSKVSYDANAPNDCTVVGTVPADNHHLVYTTVELSSNQLSCPGYTFKGWKIATRGVVRFNNDYFRMPENEVIIKAIWAKPTIAKSLDGTIHRRVTATFDTGTIVNSKLKGLSGQNGASYNTQNTTIISFEYKGTLPAGFTPAEENTISSSTSETPIYAWYDSGIIYYYTAADDIYFNADSSRMFMNLRTLNSLPDIGDINSSRTTNISYMFTLTGYNSSTFSIDLSNWDTSNVTDMSYLFDHAGFSATTWTVGDISDWDTSNVTNMSRLFNYASHKTTAFTYDLSGWNTSKVTDMSSMFYYAGYNATTWTVGDISHWNTSNVTNMSNMFAVTGYNATNFSLDLSGWNTSKVTDMSHMFNHASYSSSTLSINFTGWDTSKVTDMSHMFDHAGYNVSSFTIDFSDWNTSSLTDVSYMFERAGYNSSTFSLDFTGWDTSKVTDTNHMFYVAGYNATTWTIGDISGWNMSNVENMSYMFDHAGYNATTWNIGALSGWNTSKVTNMSYLFNQSAYRASSFSFNLSGWITSNVTDMSNMFNFAGYSATTWTIGDISGWDTSKVENMSNMFAVAGYNATSFDYDLSGWNTSSLTNMDNMFNHAGYLATTSFSLNLSGWDTSRIQNMQALFGYAGYRAPSFSLNVTGWDTSNVTDMSSIFYYAGNDATTWSLTGISGWNTSNVTNLSNALSQAGYKAPSFSLDLSGWNTSKVTDMSGMFYCAGYNATTWTIGDISSWNTSNVTNMSNTFNHAGYNATSFSLDLSGWNTSKVTDMTDMFTVAGKYSSTWSLTIPQTNGDGISNTTSALYGSTTSVSATPPSSRSFTLAP